MRLTFLLPIIVFGVLLPGGIAQGDTAQVASNTRDSELDRARQLGWQVALAVVRQLAEGDQSQSPGIEAWLKDFREQTQGLDPKDASEKWPKVDIDAIMTRNPNFWQAYFEIAPGDPGMGILQTGMLLGCGEIERALRVIWYYRFRPGMPKEVFKTFVVLSNAGTQAQDKSNVLVRAGIQLFDKSDYAAAAGKFREALAIWPQNGWAHYELAYTQRTQDEIAAGRQPNLPGPGGVAAQVNAQVKMKPSADVMAMLAKSRRYSPFMLLAYQGEDQQVLQGTQALARKALPAIKALGESPDPVNVDPLLLQLAEGCQEASLHDFALLARQIIVARRRGYDPSDHPFITTNLRALVPGPQTEATLQRLAGERATFRQLVVTEDQTPGKEHSLPDGRTPHTPSGEKTYAPETGAKGEPIDEKVKLELVRLLTPDEEMAANVSSADAFALYVKKAKQIAQSVLSKSDKPMKVLVEFRCSPSDQNLTITHQPKQINQDLLRELREALGKMEKPPVKKAEVAFQLQFAVAPEAAGSEALNRRFGLGAPQCIKEKTVEETFVVVFPVNAQKPEYFKDVDLHVVYVVFDKPIETPPDDLENTNKDRVSLHLDKNYCSWPVHSVPNGIAGEARQLMTPLEGRAAGTRGVLKFRFDAIPADKDIGLYLIGKGSQINISNVLVFRRTDFIIGDSEAVLQATWAKITGTAQADEDKATQPE